MNKFIPAILIIIMAFLGSDFNVILRPSDGISTRDVVSGADYPQQDGGSDDRLFQYRSMWLEGYQIINHSEVRKVIKVARDSNINCVTPLINAHSLGTFYNSSFHPRYRDLAWDFDPLMDLIREAHKYNIHVMPWFHTMVDPQAIGRHPEWGCVTNTGARSGSWLNPTLPEVQQYLADVVYQLFRDYPLDGIHLDAIRYPSASYGYDTYSIAEYTAEGWTNFNAFRREQITECLISVHDSISKIRPYVWIGADIGSSYSTRQNSWFQDTENWSQMGKIDFVAPMIYTTSSASLESTLIDNIIRHSCPVVCGNYVYVPEDPSYGSVPDEETGMAILQNQTERAMKVGALGTCFFAYKFLADHPFYHRSLREGVFFQKALCPLKEQSEPVRTNEWNFDLDQDREGWRVTEMGNYFPLDGVWSVVNVKEPKFMSPLLDLSAPGINVLELSMRSESKQGNVTVYWSRSESVFDDENSLTFQILGNEDWNLYSIHLDQTDQWYGNIRYLRITPEFAERTNITIDLIRVTWMPDCIKAWAYLGPFMTGTNEGLLDREFVEDETSIKPRLGDIAGGREWKDYWIDRDQVDLRFVLGHVKDAVTYSHVYIRSDEDRIVEMRHGNSDGARIWLNGKEVFYFDGMRRVAPDQDITYVAIDKGINTLLIKQVVYLDDNSFFMRFTGPGNVSLDDLEFFNELPLIGEPVIISDLEDWIGYNDVLIRWGPPKISAGFDHYLWKIDDGPEIVTYAEEFLFEDLSEGMHRFDLRCVDNLGFIGLEKNVLIRIDTQQPLISAPQPMSEIISDPVIRWDWMSLFAPPSGILEYLVTVECWKRGSTEITFPVLDEKIEGTHFILDHDLRDGYMYKLLVKAVSGAGKSFIISSEIDVLLDLTSPSKPTGATMVQLGFGSREYLLSWYPSMENTEFGIDHYEIWWRIDEGDWSLKGITSETNFTLERPLRHTIDVKVRAKDLSYHYSDFTPTIGIENREPDPVIIPVGAMVPGMTITFRTQQMMDPDGTIIDHQWFLDDILLSRMDHLVLTLGPGSYDLTIIVQDDQGKIGKDVLRIVIPYGEPENLNSTVLGWLMDSSLIVIDNPPVDVPHYHNTTVIIDENGTHDRDPLLKEFLMNSMTLFTAVPLIVLVLMIVVYLFVGETMGLRSEKGPPPQDEIWDEHQIGSRQEDVISFMKDQISSSGKSHTKDSKPTGVSTSSIDVAKSGFSDLIRTSIIGPALEAIDQVIQEDEWEELEWDEELDEWEEVEE